MNTHFTAYLRRKFRLIRPWVFPHVIALILPLMWTLFLAGCMAAPAHQSTIAPAGGFSTEGTTGAKSPTLADLWAGTASFRMEILDTGLPMGESDTISAPQAWQESTGHTHWSYIHASYQSLGVVDQCGEPVEFPGCLVIFASEDGGHSFAPLRRPLEFGTLEVGSESPVICQIPCRACPCTSMRDHIDQQQYPRVERYKVGPNPDVFTWLMVYEYRANVFLRRSADGLAWSVAEEIPLTGIWQDWLMPCPQDAGIGPHPFSPAAYDCLVGSPPGLYIDAPADEETGAPEVYIFVGLGQNPGAMGCYRGALHAPAALYRQCDQNPLFVGVEDYGPRDDSGPGTNPWFDFRTISSAEVIRIEDQYYMLYEGVRGPDAGAAGDTQFALGLARTTAGVIDGPWETFAGNPIVADMPGNVGVGHADLVVLDGISYLYTTPDGVMRSRLQLEWNTASAP